MASKHNSSNNDALGGKHEHRAISRLLPVGKDNAISSKELMKLTRCDSIRTLQAAVAREREQGSIICFSTSGGYYLPANRAEIKEFCRIMERREMSTRKALKSAQAALRLPEWQQTEGR